MKDNKSKKWRLKPTFDIHETQHSVYIGRIAKLALENNYGVWIGTREQSDIFEGKQLRQLVNISEEFNKFEPSTRDRIKMIDLVIVGLDELKSVMIITSKPNELAEVITGEMGLGLTVMYGRGGYSGNAKEILMVIVERLDLSDLKELVLREDSNAFMAVENLHEVVYAKPPKSRKRKSRKA
ncbi:MAG: YitT family protein [Alphaproteobacteria bacterium]|nr:YitT family protein [Alphaproteobacteria bacterium]